MVQDLAERVQRERAFAIVDEVDNILIDEARTPLIISGQAEESGDLYYTFARLVPKLQGRLEGEEEGGDFFVDLKDKAVSPTEEGIDKIEKLLGVENLYDSDPRLARHFEQALRAHALYRRDRDYIVKDGEIVIVDEFTGRQMPGRRWSEGLHQAVEAKEGVKVQREIVTNMAGRGTDILLGGNPAGLASEILHKRGLNPAEVDKQTYAAALAEAKAITDEDHERVVGVGGLHIIGTERHDSRRIDNQLR